MSDIRDLLFKPVVDEDKFNPNFKQALNEPFQYARKVIETWAEGFEDRDGKFITEFQTTFNSAFWELYLFAVLKQLGYVVDFTKDRPDFCTSKFCIEATIASHSKEGIPEWERDYSFDPQWNLEDAVNYSTIRLANAFISKARKLRDSYSILPHVEGKPFIIAIAPFEQPFFYVQSQHAIRRVLYGYDRVLAIDWDEHTREVFGDVYLEQIDKGNGSTIPLGFFLNPEYADVSAVIFSNVATFGKARVLSDDHRIILIKSLRFNDYGLEPFNEVHEKEDYNETLLDGLTIFHNPYAKNPLKPEDLLSNEIAHITYSLKDNEMVTNIPHQFLFQRIVTVINSDNTPEELNHIRQKLKETTSTNNDSQYPKFHL
ncbi:hypothetical protein [Brevibacillus sp. HD1.4A]|uniref:hypothetical protein n=1 Tax=Brevibacillus sp. HD1.4A TaxID=2738978 RepID=UPI00156A80C0|nr:hypothetical protein [Brevibacillus sp. HD1.4A]NRQ56051.1 hypothetical protein [Brevibacillus sp. HD1.4A]